MFVVKIKKSVYKALLLRIAVLCAFAALREPFCSSRLACPDFRCFAQDVKTTKRRKTLSAILHVGFYFNDKLVEVVPSIYYIIDQPLVVYRPISMNEAISEVKEWLYALE